MFSRTLLLMTLAVCSHAQSAASLTSPEWSRPFEPLQLIGNVYYVGTYDLACYLIVTPEGDILINTGLSDSAAMIKASIEKLGFKVTDIKILLTTHGHWDHAAAI